LLNVIWFIENKTINNNDGVSQQFTAITDKWRHWLYKN
jgi:hypothetical protein